MKVAVTAKGKDLSSPVDSHFARARYFLIVDIDSSVFTIRNNIDLQQILYLAGTQAAGSLIGLGVQVVITANIGPKAFATLKSARVRIFQAKSGDVAEVLDQFQAGQLVELANANVEEYWPQHSNP